MITPTQSAPSGEAAALLEVDVHGALVQLRARYDPALVERLKALPGRRYVPQDTAWVLPASREAFAALTRLLIELGSQATLTERARIRLERHGPGRLAWCDGEFELRAAPRPRRLAKIRALPERRWLAARRCWRVPGTRAGALALQALTDDGELVATPPACARLQQLVHAHTAPHGHDAPSGGERERASPIAHWRHVTRGPVFAANPARRQWVDGVGWCVRVRVDPDRPRPSQQR